MPSIKHWYHASQDLNRDPQFREYAKRFGLPGVRLWHEFLAMLDRADNFLDLHRGFDWGLLAASCESKKRHMLACYEHLVNIRWLRVGVDANMKMFIYAPNWAKYNKKREDKGSMMDSTREDQSLHPTPAPKKEKKKEKPSTIFLNGLQESLNQFWQAYPKKAGKGAVEKIWAKLKPDEELVGIMLEKIETQKHTPKWTENGGEFIPYPSTWLNQKRWLDEPVVVEKKKIPMKDWI